MSRARPRPRHRLTRAARLLALVLGVLSPSVAFGNQVIHLACLGQEAAEHHHHHHGGEAPPADAGPGPACTWLGPCSGPLAAAELPGAVRLVLEDAPVAELRPRPAASRPVASPVAYLHPPAIGPPPAS